MKQSFQKNKRERVVFLGIGALLCVLVCVSMMWTGLPVAHYVPDEKALVKEFTREEMELHACSFREDGMLEFVGENPYIELGGQEKEIEMVALQMTEPAAEGVLMIVTAEDGSGEEFSVKCTRESEYICVELPVDTYSSLRIRFDREVKIAGIGLYDKAAVLQPGWFPRTPLRIAIGLVLAAFLWLVLLWAELRWRLGARFARRLRGQKKAILCDLGLAAVSLLLSAAVTFLLCGCKLRIGAVVFGFSVIASLLFLGVHDRQGGVPVEKTFAVWLLLAGIAMIGSSHLGNISWDEQSHYQWTLESSVLRGATGITEADDEIIKSGTANLEETYEQQASYYNAKGDYVVTSLVSNPKIFYLPAGMVIAVAKALRLPFVWRFQLGRFAQLLVYVLCCYFGMKRLHSGKMILGVIAAIPCNLFLAVNYSYDYWVVCFSLLGMAYFVGNCQEKEQEVSLKDTVIMCAALSLACLPKQIYAPLLLFPFLMLPKKTKNKRRWYYLICAAAFVLIFSSLLFRSTAEVSGTGDIRGGAVGPMDQLQLIFSRPVWYAGMLLQFILSYLNPLESDYMTKFAYLGGVPGVLCLTVLLAVVTLTDKTEEEKGAYPVPARLYAVPMVLGEIALIATAMYLSFTPVGNEAILGCQPRYLLPLLYPLCSILCGKGIPLKKVPKKVYHAIVLVPLFGVLYYDIYLSMLSRTL